MKLFGSFYFCGFRNEIHSDTNTKLSCPLYSNSNGHHPCFFTYVGGLGTWLFFYVGHWQPFFAPLLTVFLTLSSLLLLTEVVGIPNQTLAYLLSTLSNAWNYLLSFGSSDWIMECAKPPAWVLISIPILTYVVLHHRWVNSTARRLAVMSVLLIACYATFSFQKYHNAVVTPVLKFNEQLYVIKLVKGNGIILVDNGFFARKKSVEKAIDYELKPWIVKHFGKVHIAEVRLNAPGKRSFQAVMHMYSIWKVNEVFY